MGGSYGYCIGYMDNGVLHATKNLGRENFAIMADAPREERPDRQSADHGGRGQNVLFEDGHVGFLTSSRPSGWSDDIFANDRNQVAAGVHRDDSVIVSSGVAPDCRRGWRRGIGDWGSGIGDQYNWRCARPASPRAQSLSGLQLGVEPRVHARLATRLLARPGGIDRAARR